MKSSRPIKRVKAWSYNLLQSYISETVSVSTIKVDVLTFRNFGL
jgi:hypothetical protein